MKADRITHPYFLGIGGIGMSALAFHYLQQGCKVSGYDRVCTPLTKKLEEAGAVIHYTEDPALIPQDVSTVIYTPAIPADHGEWESIRQRGLRCYKRAEILGVLCRLYRTVAVAGTHGKTTTSSLIAYLLQSSIGCNAILGGLSINMGGNYHHDAKSQIMVTEADEYDHSFWQLYPYFSVVTSWDPDHMDVYGTLENMRAAYVRFMRQSDRFIADSALDLPFQPRFYYGLEKDGKARAYAENIRVENGAYIFTYVGPRGRIENLRMVLPGRHNIENAVAAISIALEMGVGPAKIRALLPGFKGVKRRLEYCHKGNKWQYYDDYAHHPAEIEASISALRDCYPDFKLVVIFQPHLYTRTRDLCDTFASSLSEADELCLADIYPAREQPIEGVTSRLIGDKIQGKEVSYCNCEDIPAWVEKRTQRADGKSGLLFVTMGAGNIDRSVEPLIRFFDKEDKA